MPPEQEPEPMPDLNAVDGEQLLGEILDSLHKVGLFPLKSEIVVLCSHRKDDGERVELMLATNDADLVRVKGVLGKMYERL